MTELHPEPVFLHRLKMVLKVALKQMGINAEAYVEDIDGLPLKRVYVVAEEFGKLHGGERYDLVWRILKEDLTRDERFCISMTASLTPQEFRDYVRNADSESPAIRR